MTTTSPATKDTFPGNKDPDLNEHRIPSMTPASWNVLLYLFSGNRRSSGTCRIPWQTTKRVRIDEAVGRPAAHPPSARGHLAINDPVSRAGGRETPVTRTTRTKPAPPIQEQPPVCNTQKLVGRRNAGRKSVQRVRFCAGVLRPDFEVSAYPGVEPFAHPQMPTKRA